MLCFQNTPAGFREVLRLQEAIQELAAQEEKGGAWRLWMFLTRLLYVNPQPTSYAVFYVIIKKKLSPS